ncbi:hypothetical protein [Gallibacterium anatis]|uniref:hypothetical protein n=1 Tax=Gallibacterium anatis TaxID=750 RepID=UPI00053210DE|nr:hypothetical protein [Gallibacterium anatis]KGQ29356.1 hypothetical protein JP27_01225 [Gallibacterium anatis]
MSSLQDFNKILNDFENEIKNLKDITGAYNKMQRLIQLQIELTSKIDENIKSIHSVVEQQKDLDLSKQLESLNILSKGVSDLTSQVEKHIDESFMEANNSIRELKNSLINSIAESTDKNHSNSQDVKEFIDNKTKLINDSISKELHNVLSVNQENINNILEKSIINEFKNNQKNSDRKLDALLESFELDFQDFNKKTNGFMNGILERLDSKYSILDKKIKAIEESLEKEYKLILKDNKLIKIIIIITLICSISANVIHFIK